MIEIAGLSAGYKNQRILKNLDLKIPEGTFTALLGPNGAGKSTLLKCLCGFLPPWEGSIKLQGREIGGLSRRQLARKVAIIPQNFGLQFDYLVRDLVLMGRFPYLNYLGNYQKTDLLKVEEVLEKLGLSALANRSFSELSGGEQQRVAIGRALAQETPILLLDEAFANLDINHTLVIMQLLQDINHNSGKTLLLVSHNINLAAEFCSEAVIMKNGEIEAHGKPKEIITGEILSRVYEHPLQVISNPLSGQPNLVYSV